jgi:hypothetical protein
MKLLLAFLFITISLRSFSQPAQPDSNLLDKDPVFRKILSRRLSYPPINAQSGHTKLVYGQFEIDENGHVRNVKIVNPAVGRGYFVNFDVVVEKTLKRLPPLNPRYLGKYMLPVIFALNDLQTGELVTPTNTNFDGRLANSILLKSVTVIGDKQKPPRGASVGHPDDEF